MKTKKLLVQNFLMLILTIHFSLVMGQDVKHVVLISLDGSMPEFYMNKSWPAPNLQRLKSEGVFAAKGIKSVFPSLTYPAHTSIITGAYPIHHGIYYNIPFFVYPYGSGPVHHNWYAYKIKCKTLWDAVKAAGLTSGSVEWPVTVGAPIDYNFPVLRPEKGEKEDILSIKYPHISPKDLLSEIQKKTGYHITAEDFLLSGDERDKMAEKISSFIIKNYRPALMTIHLGWIDYMEHKHGTSGLKLRRAVKLTDSLVGNILQSIHDAGIWRNTTVIIVGDHGHTNTKAFFYPNVYLRECGLISRNNWKARFYSAGGTAFLYLKYDNYLKKGNHKTTIDSVISILKHSHEFHDGLFEIMDRKALNKVGANPNTPLAISMKEGIVVKDESSGKAFEKYNGPQKSTHGYDPTYQSMHTTFIAVGAGIAKHKNIKGMQIVDIAPLISRLLGLDFEAPDGKLFSNILSK